MSSVRSEWGRVSVASAVREREEALRSALGAFTARAELLRALPGRRAALEARRREMERTLGGLGLELDAREVLALELGAAARGTLEALAEGLAGAEVERREAERELARTGAERTRLEDALSRLQGERTRLPGVPVAQLRQRQAALGKWRLLRGEREQVTAQRTELQQRLQALRAQAEPELGPAPSALPVWLGVGVAVVWVGALWRLSGGAGALLSLVGAVLLLVTLGLGHRRARRDHEAQREAHDARQQQLARELARVQSSLDALSGRWGGLERALGVAASEAGVAAEAPLSGFAGMEAELAEAVRKADRVEHLEREWEAREAERDRVVREAQAAEFGALRAGARESALREELAELLETRGFPPDLAAPRALELWRDVAELRRRLADLGAEERALLADEAGCAEVGARLREEARAGGIAEAPSESLPQRVGSALEELKTRDAEARALRTRGDELAAERARLVRLAESEAQALAALWARGGCEAEEPFRQRARQAERYGELTRRLGELTWRIEATTGLEESRAREALGAAGGEAELKETLARLRLQAPAGAETLKALHTEYGAARSQLALWEGDEQLASLRIEEERLKARAGELATLYARDRLALGLMARARRRFEEEQQPRVIQLASEHFATLTGGRYRRVFLPAGGGRELRVSHEGGEKSPEQLSRGTREQLYLAFRLAVIQDFGETRGALPLIVDDILVNFDLERTRSTLEVLARLSERHQVIAFTCHPWVRELFEEQGARTVELASRGPTPLLSPGPPPPLRLFG